MHGVSRDVICPAISRGGDVEFCLKGGCAMFHELDNGCGFCALDPVDAAEAVRDAQIEKLPEYCQIIESVLSVFVKPGECEEDESESEK